MGFDPVKEPGERACDARTWSPSCKHDVEGSVEGSGDKYLCKVCGKEIPFEHEMHHEHFPHISGTEGMS